MPHIPPKGPVYRLRVTPDVCTGPYANGTGCCKCCPPSTCPEVLGFVLGASPVRAQIVFTVTHFFCPNAPSVLASSITNCTTDCCWDLTPYQVHCLLGPTGGTNPDAISACRLWRLIERGFDDIFAEGDVSNCGTLMDLPAEFCSSFAYNGYMELQLGCIDYFGNETWPP